MHWAVAEAASASQRSLNWPAAFHPLCSFRARFLLYWAPKPNQMGLKL
jgi:hypothetical protein